MITDDGIEQREVEAGKLWTKELKRVRWVYPASGNLYAHRLHDDSDEYGWHFERVIANAETVEDAYRIAREWLLS